MSKKLRFVMLVTAAVFITIVASACNPQPLIKFDPNKTQVYVYLPNNALGYKWAQKLAIDFNQLEGNEEYEVIAVPTDNAVPTVIESQLKTNTTNGHVFFTSTPNIVTLTSADMAVDLSEMADEKVYDANGDYVGAGGVKSINDKLTQRELIYNAFGKVGGGDQGLYALPYAEGFNGLIFDYGLFMEKGWLQTEMHEGQVVLSRGPDGKFGTYDDGQPATYSEWLSMLNDIKRDSDYPFIYTTQYSYAYIPPVPEAIRAQFMGIDNYSVINSFQGDIKDINGNVLDTVTPQTGYKVFSQPGMLEAYKFTKDMFLSDKALVHPVSWQTTATSHKDAQRSFVLGYMGASSNPQAAMLLEGVWWEHEARPVFASLAAQNEEGRGFGEREYRLMMYPRLNGQLGANGDGTGSVFTVMDCGVSFIAKNGPDDVIQKAKEFLQYTLSNHALSYFHAETGVPRAFTYTFEDEDYQKLTPFQKHVWEVYQDTENVKIINYSYERLASPFYSAQSFPGINYSVVNNLGSSTIYNNLLNASAQTVYNNSISYYTPERWVEYYNRVSQYYEQG